MQIIIALVVTPEGLPLAYEVLPGNTADKTTLRGFLERIERQYGEARRGLADAQGPHSYVGTGKRCVAVSNGSGCRPRSRPPAALWTGDHRAYPLPLDT